MNDEIVIEFAYDRALFRRAMTGWWQSVVPPVPFVKRVIFWTIVWFALLGVTFALTAFGLTPWFMAAGLIGAGVLIAAFAYLQQTRMGRFWDAIGSHWDRAGETRVVLGAGGLRVEDAVSRRDYDWAAIDAVRAVRGGTVLRSGISMLALPDAALPADLTPRELRDRIARWRA